MAEDDPPRERHWGNVAAGFSAACALAVSAYTAYLQRQQVKAQVWPILVWGFSASTVNEPDAGAGGRADGGGGSADESSEGETRHPAFSFDLKNQGVGPAVVRAMEVTFDGQPIRRWDDLLPKMTSLFADPPLGWDGRITLTHSRVIAAGEQTKPFQPYGEEQPRAMYQVFRRIAVKLCYCSVLEDCWEIHAKGYEDEPEPERVSSCFHPAVPFEQ